MIIPADFRLYCPVACVILTMPSAADRNFLTFFGLPLLGRIPGETAGFGGGAIDAAVHCLDPILWMQRGERSGGSGGACRGGHGLRAARRSPILRRLLCYRGRTTVFASSICRRQVLQGYRGCDKSRKCGLGLAPSGSRRRGCACLESGWEDGRTDLPQVETLVGRRSPSPDNIV